MKTNFNMKRKIILISQLLFLVISMEINPQVIYDTLYRHPDTTTFYNMGITVVGDITNLAVRYQVDSTWKSFQIEKIIYVHPQGVDTSGFVYFNLSIGDSPEDTIIYVRKVYLTTPHFPTTKVILLDTPVVINENQYFYLSGSFLNTLSISQYYQFGIPGQYAFWFTPYQWIEYVPCYFKIKIVIKKNVSGIHDNSLLMKDLNLGQNFPNPFNSQTKIGFHSEESGVAKMDIFDILGNKVKSLTKDIILDSDNEFIINGEKLNSGVYFYQLLINNKWISTKKMIVLK